MDLRGGDLGSPKRPAESTAEMGERIPGGTIEAGDAHTLTKLDRKKGEKEKENNKKENRKKSEKEKEKHLMECRKRAEKEKEKHAKECRKRAEKEKEKHAKECRKRAEKEKNNKKENRKKGEKEKVKKEKANRKEMSSGRWRLRRLKRLFRCFVCGGGDDMSQYEWQFSPEEERLWIEESIRRNREADLQKSLKLQEVDLKHKMNFEHMLRRRKITEANKEWSAIPTRPEEEVERKVTFQEIDACDVWFYQDEANPRLGQAWKKVLREIKDNEMARALQAKWPKKEKLIIVPEKEEDVDLCDLLTGSMLCLGFGVLLCIWLSPLLQ